MTPTKKTTRDLATAFREAGFDDVDTAGDRVVLKLDSRRRLDVQPVSVGHGRPQELRNALAHVLQNETVPVTATFVARQFTTGALDILKEQRVNYLDEKQFVFNSRDPFVAIRHNRVVGQEATAPRERVGLGGKTGIAVQELLLADRGWWKVTELAEEAGVAAGTAQAALKRLEDLGLVEVEGAGPRKRRRLVNRPAVLDRWVEDARRERGRLVTTYIQAQGARDLAKRVSERLDRASIDHALTGACAALLVAPHITDVRRCEVWVSEDVSESAVLDALGTDRVDKGGNVTILRAKNDAPLFGRQAVDGIEIVNLLRLYADLLQDPRRGEEQAEFLRETVLHM